MRLDKDIVVFSNSLDFIKTIYKNCNLQIVFIEKSKVNLGLKKFIKDKKIKSYLVSRNLDILKKNINHKIYAFSYGFGIIFTKEVINKFKYGIWNFHPGLLPNYRGRHPISWALINNEKKIGISVHLINDKIDMGYLIYQNVVRRNKNDNDKDIEKKIIKKIKDNFIKKTFNNFEQNNIKKLKKGKYYPSLFNGINIKSPKLYNSTKIFNIFKSQENYNGVLLNNIRYKKAFRYSKKILSTYDMYEIQKFKDNKKLILIK
jgi:methionyl-tRNA formyltransferase